MSQQLHHQHENNSNNIKPIYSETKKNILTKSINVQVELQASKVY